MEPSNSTTINVCFEVKNRCDERLKVLIPYRETLSLNDPFVPEVDELIQKTLRALFISSSTIQILSIKEPKALTKDQWIIIKATEKKRINILNAFRRTLSPDSPHISSIDKAIVESKTDLLVSKITIQKLWPKKRSKTFPFV